MSAGYGYFRIEFYKADGKPDAAAAKRAYKWCIENYSWFYEETPFLLEDNTFVANEDDYPEGVDIKHGDIPDNIIWLAKPFRESKASRMVASIWADFSDSSFIANSYFEGAWAKGRPFNYYSVDGFNTIISPAFYNGGFLSESGFREIKALFKKY